MSENRRKILEMLSSGQITAEEADRLISALEKERTGSSPAQAPDSSTRPKAKYLRVVVEAERSDAHGPHKANVRIPMQLLRAGVKLASLIPPQARDRVNDALRRHGAQVDIEQLKPENLEELIDSLDDVTVDLDHERHKAKVTLSRE